MTVHIYGAGMAGLLAAHIMRSYDPIVHERQSSLPDNHGALLRFRSDVVARETGLRFQAVRVHKAIMGDDGELRNVATLRDNNMYSHKVTGKVQARSALNLSPCDRYVAPPDFLAALARGVNIVYNDSLSMERLHEHDAAGDHIISTIPMPSLMAMVNWHPKPLFGWRPIWTATVYLDTQLDVYQTIYYPGNRKQAYRASITGRRVTIEFASNTEALNSETVAGILDDFGIPFGEWSVESIKRQEYGKLTPIDDNDRQQFILHATDNWRVYSVGRFATWRQILLDDVVSDVHKVERWIAQRNDYRRRLEA